MAVQCVVCGSCYAIGDCVAQKLEKAYSVQSPGKTGYNYQRTARMGFFGLVVGGPVIYTWFKNLHKMTAVFRYSYVPVQSSAGSSWIRTLAEGSYQRKPLDETTDAIRNLVVKMFFDQAFFNAMFLNTYMCVMSLLEGRSISEACVRMKRDFHDQWATMVVFWVPIQCVNFLCVPAHLNGVFVMVMNVGWTTLLSMLNHSRDYGAAPQAEVSVSKLATEYEETDLSTKKELELKLQTLRCQLTERRSQICDQLHDLKEQQREIDEVLILTDERQLRKQKHRIQEALLLSDGHSGDVSDFLQHIRHVEDGRSM